MAHRICNKGLGMRFVHGIDGMWIENAGLIATGETAGDYLHRSMSWRGESIEGCFKKPKRQNPAQYEGG